MGKGGGGGGGGGGSTPILSEIASIYSSTEQAKAAHKALDAQKKALELQRSIWNREIDPDKFDRLAVEYDTRQIERRQEFLKTYEPELYELRQLSKQQLLDSAKETKSQSESHQLATKLF